MRSLLVTVMIALSPVGATAKCGEFSNDVCETPDGVVLGSFEAVHDPRHPLCSYGKNKDICLDGDYDAVFEALRGNYAASVELSKNAFRGKRISAVAQLVRKKTSLSGGGKAITATFVTGRFGFVCSTSFEHSVREMESASIGSAMVIEGTPSFATEASPGKSFILEGCTAGRFD